jgi:hypothetical protein
VAISKNQGGNLFRKTIGSESDQNHNARAAVTLHDTLGRPGPYQAPYETSHVSWLRFALTDSFDGTSFEAPALALDNDGNATTIPVTITDLLQRFQPTAVAGDMGYAKAFRLPDGTTRYEVDTVGNTSGGGGGGGSDHKVALNSADNMGGGADYLEAKIANPGAYDAGTMRLVQHEDNGDGTERFFFQVDDLGGTGIDTKKFKVKHDGSDAEGFAIDKVSPVATKGGSDVDVKFDEVSGNLTAWVPASSITTIINSTVPVYTASAGVQLVGNDFRAAVNTTIRSVTGLTLTLSSTLLTVTLTYHNYQVYAVDPGTSGTIASSVAATTSCP